MIFKSVLLDTSFFIRLLKKNDPLSQSATDYFIYFLQKNITMVVSTVAIAEFCVRGDIGELPLKNLQILPFNLNHAKRAGALADIVYTQRNNNNFIIDDRKIIPNDTKLFAQADCENSIDLYISSDTKSKSIFNLLKENTTLRFDFIDLNVSYKETFGLLF